MRIIIFIRARFADQTMNKKSSRWILVKKNVRHYRSIITGETRGIYPENRAVDPSLIDSGEYTLQEESNDLNEWSRRLSIPNKRMKARVPYTSSRGPSRGAPTQGSRLHRGPSFSRMRMRRIRV